MEVASSSLDTLQLDTATDLGYSEDEDDIPRLVNCLTTILHGSIHSFRLNCQI